MKTEKEPDMRAEYDFSAGKRGALFQTKGKTRITIYLDDAIIEAFRNRAEAEGTGYQTMINAALRDYLSKRELIEERIQRVLQRVLRQELKGAVSELLATNARLSPRRPLMKIDSRRGPK